MIDLADLIDSESISLQFIGSNVQREYSKAYNQLNSCSHFKEQLNAPSYDRRREDPLMSDLMWEKVDPNNECIPRMKQPTISSEDETSFADENDSHSNLISDTSLKYRSFFSNDKKSSSKSTITSDNYVPKTKKNKKSAKRTKKVNHGNKGSNHRAQSDLNTKIYSTPDESSITDDYVNKNDFPTEQEDSTSSTSVSTPIKVTRQSTLDATKKVSELLTQQLSIMWCLKEFETKSNDKKVDSKNKKNVLGQVIQQGSDIYFQPTTSKHSKIKKNDKTTLKNKTSNRSLSMKESDLESVELESDSASISFANKPSNHSTKKKKSKKLKRRHVSKRTQTSKNRSISKSKRSVPLSTQKPNHQQSRTACARRISSREETGRSMESYDTSSYDEESFNSRPMVDKNYSSQSHSSLNTRSRNIHRSMQSRGGNR